MVSLQIKKVILKHKAWKHYVNTNTVSISNLKIQDCFFVLTNINITKTY